MKPNENIINKIAELANQYISPYKFHSKEYKEALVKLFDPAAESKNYTKEEILKAAEIGEVSMIDARHVVSKTAVIRWHGLLTTNFK